MTTAIRHHHAQFAHTLENGADIERLAAKILSSHLLPLLEHSLDLVKSHEKLESRDLLQKSTKILDIITNNKKDLEAAGTALNVTYSHVGRASAIDLVKKMTNVIDHKIKCLLELLRESNDVKAQETDIKSILFNISELLQGNQPLVMLPEIHEHLSLERQIEVQLATLHITKERVGKQLHELSLPSNLLTQAPQKREVSHHTLHESAESLKAYCASLHRLICDDQKLDAFLKQSNEGNGLPCLKH